MSRRLHLLFSLLLIAAPAAAQQSDEKLPAEESGPITRHTANRDSPLLDFEYSWPQAIASQTKLVAELNSDLSKNYDEALKNARENKAMVDENHGTFTQNMYARAWTLAGEAPRFLSLVANTDTFGGGAHPNHDSSALLWDRGDQRQVPFADLFASADDLAGAIRSQYCKLLDAERASRRGGEVLDGDFAKCPEFSELTIFPADTDGNGRFDTINLIADPYVAGPYSEGDYDILVRVGPSLIAALKPEYRGDFESHRAQ